MKNKKNKDIKQYKPIFIKQYLKEHYKNVRGCKKNESNFDV